MPLGSIGNTPRRFWVNFVSGGLFTNTAGGRLDVAAPSIPGIDAICFMVIARNWLGAARGCGASPEEDRHRTADRDGTPHCDELSP